MSEENSDWKKEAGILKAEITACNDSQKKLITIVIGTFAMVLGTASLMLLYGALKTWSLDAREKAAISAELRAELRAGIASEMAKATDKLNNHFETRIGQGLLPSLNSINQKQMGSVAFLYSFVDAMQKDLPNAAVRTTFACSFFLMAGDEENAQVTLDMLTTQMLPQLNSTNLVAESRSSQGEPIQTHFTNLINQLQTNNSNGRYSIPIRDFKAAIRAAEARK